MIDLVKKAPLLKIFNSHIYHDQARVGDMIQIGTSTSPEIVNSNNSIDFLP